MESGFVSLCSLQTVWNEPHHDGGRQPVQMGSANTTPVAFSCTERSACFFSMAAIISRSSSAAFCASLFCGCVRTATAFDFRRDSFWRGCRPGAKRSAGAVATAGSAGRLSACVLGGGGGRGEEGAAPGFASRAARRCLTGMYSLQKRARLD